MAACARHHTTRKDHNGLLRQLALVGPRKSCSGTLASARRQRLLLEGVQRPGFRASILNGSSGTWHGAQIMHSAAYTGTVGVIKIQHKPNRAVQWYPLPVMECEGVHRGRS
jgi:hypothetical protein